MHLGLGLICDSKRLLTYCSASIQCRNPNPNLTPTLVACSSVSLRFSGSAVSSAPFRYSTSRRVNKNIWIALRVWSRSVAGRRCARSRPGT